MDNDMDSGVCRIYIYIYRDYALRSYNPSIPGIPSAYKPFIATFWDLGGLVVGL